MNRPSIIITFSFFANCFLASKYFSASKNDADSGPFYLVKLVVIWDSALAEAWAFTIAASAAPSATNSFWRFSASAKLIAACLSP